MWQVYALLDAFTGFVPCRLVKQITCESMAWPARFGRLLIGLAALISATLRADDTFVYAVQISATVQTSPPEIQLHWEPDPYGAKRYTVFRKNKDGASWGTGIALPGTATTYTDRNVVVGSSYEYQIAKVAN